MGGRSCGGRWGLGWLVEIKKSVRNEQTAKRGVGIAACSARYEGAGPFDILPLLSKFAVVTARSGGEEGRSDAL